MRTPIRQRFRFGRLWTATVASNLGDGLVLAAFPLMATTITVDPIAISVITLASGLPWLVLAPVSGAIVDRFDRRILMVSFDAFRAVTLGPFALAVWNGMAPLWALYLVVFVIAAGETVVDTAAQSILPAIVPRERLDLANGRLFSTMTVAHRLAVGSELQFAVICSDRWAWASKAAAIAPAVLAAFGSSWTTAVMMAPSIRSINCLANERGRAMLASLASCSR